MNAEMVLSILELLDIVASVAIRSAEVRGKFSELRSELKGMVLEGRDPTATEWERMNTRTDELHALIQGRPPIPE